MDEVLKKIQACRGFGLSINDISIIETLIAEIWPLLEKVDPDVDAIPISFEAAKRMQAAKSLRKWLVRIRAVTPSRKG